MKKLMPVMLLSFTSFVSAAMEKTAPNQTNKDYCKSSGGKIIKAVAQFDTHTGWVNGVTKEFCQYLDKEGNLAMVGLETLSIEPTLAATYTQKVIVEKGKGFPMAPYSNPSFNVCNRLHGAEIGFAVFSGGFADQHGQSDICVFGDGSSISAWTLIYAAGGQRADIKNLMRSEPLNIEIPDIQS